MRLKSFALFLFIVFGAFLINVKAVSYGYSYIEAYQPTPASATRVYAETGTVLDYATWYYYDPGIRAFMFEDNYLVASTGIIMEYNNPQISVFIDLLANYGRTYTLHGDHYLGAYYYYYSGGQVYFLDQYGYNFYSGTYPTPYSFLQGPTGYYTYQIYRVATTQVSISVLRPLHLDSIDVTGGVPGATFLTTIRGTGFFGTGTGQNANQTVQVSGSGVTATVQPTSPNTIEVLDVNIEIAQDAQVGDRTLTLTVNGQTSNSINFRVGDRTPQITGITPPQGNTGDQVPVTISGTGFGFNPLIQINGQGVSPTITSSSTTQITAIFSVAQATYIGTRDVKVVSRGITGGGFTPVPGSSDTSNAVGFNVFATTVTIADVPIVEKNGERTVDVGVTGLAEGGEVKFKLKPLAGATGEANFDNNTTEIRKGNGNHTLTIKGITESSAINKMTIEATPVNASNILMHKEFTVAVISSLTFEKLNNDDEVMDTNPGNGQPNTNTGTRIFPDKKDSSDMLDRSILRVKASVLPNDPSIKVYFASFDLDDPSANAAPIDTNGSNGNENNGAVNSSKSGQLLDSTTGGCTGASISSNISKIECSVSGKGAFANYKVTMQPGDNFAVGASLVDDYRNQINIDTSAGENLINNTNQIIPVSGEANSNNVQGIRTKMLTVWRKLHIELDSMGQAHQNYVRGNVVGNSIIQRGRSKTLNVTTPDLEINRFENGRIELAWITNVLDVVSNTANTVTVRNSTANDIVLANNVNFSLLNQVGTGSSLGTIPTGQTITSMQTVTLNVAATPLDVNAFSNGQMFITPVLRSLTITSNTVNTVTVTNNSMGAISIADATYLRLYDDDDMNDDGVKDGDEGDDVAEPDTSLLTDNSSNPTNNVLAPAYVVPRYDLSGSHDEVPFFFSPTYGDLTNLLNSTSFQNLSHEAREDFWTIYLLGGYQPPIYHQGSTTRIRDGDPVVYLTGLIDTIYGAANVSSVDGTVPIRQNDGQGAILFTEVGRPNEYPIGFGTRPVSRAFTTAHEVGHLFKGVHSDQGLMASTSIRTSGIFSEISLSWIRQTTHP